MTSSILTVTPNPSVDRTLVVRGYRLGAIHRPEEVLALPGGKGLNVARTIKKLGGEVHACLLLGNLNGQWMEDMLYREGISASAAWFEGEVRQSTSVLDAESGILTEVYERGSPILSRDWEQFVRLAGECMSPSGWVALSGSLPDGAPPDGYARLAEIAHEQDAITCLDTYGEALRAVLSVRPFLVKVNAVEAGSFIGRELSSLSDIMEACMAIRKSGAGTAVVTLGSEGAVAVNQNKAWQVVSPPIQAISPVGSGDAFLGGLVLCLQRGGQLAEALKWGAAAGAANALTLGAGRFSHMDRIRIMEQLVVREI